MLTIPSRIRAPSASLAVLCALAAPGCYLAHERGDDAGPVDAGRPPLDGAAAPSLVWVLVHPADAPRGPGLYLFDEARQELLRQLPLPDGVTSPHALAWDGRSLWLGGVDVEPAVREIDPESGRVLSRWSGVVTEGIAVTDGTFWYAGVTNAFVPLVHVGRDGTTLDSLPLPEAAVQDLVSARGALFYLVNDGEDRIVRLDPSSGAAADLARGVDAAPNALGFDGSALAVAVDQRIRRFDPESGALVSERPFAVPGWITAIAFVR